jgi:hypothetical protein
MNFHQREFIGEKFFINADVFSHKTIHHMSSVMCEVVKGADLGEAEKVTDLGRGDLLGDIDYSDCMKSMFQI